jgi:hypothetical protein
MLCITSFTAGILDGLIFGFLDIEDKGESDWDVG